MPADKNLNLRGVLIYWGEMNPKHVKFLLISMLVGLGIMGFLFFVLVHRPQQLAFTVGLY